MVGLLDVIIHPSQYIEIYVCFIILLITILAGFIQSSIRKKIEKYNFYKDYYDYVSQRVIIDPDLRTDFTSYWIARNWIARNFL